MIIDITALDIVDSFVGRMLSTIASISGCSTPRRSSSACGPAVAITLVELGLSLDGVRTALNVERGLGCSAAPRDRGRRTSVDGAADRRRTGAVT